MTHAIRVHETGGPEVLRWQEVDVPDPGPGEVRLGHGAVGLNYIDVYHRTGLYPADPPFTPGLEAAGVVEAVGPEVTELAPGDRVAYAGGPLGAYAEARVLPAKVLVKLPDAIDDRTAAAMMLQGMTAMMLLRRTYRVQRGDTVLIHAASGGVGTILTQWAKHLGATVIGTVGSPEKAEAAKAHGCDHPILYREVDFAEEVRRLTGGDGCEVVYDSVGRDTFARSLDCLKPFGMMVSYGNASGPVDPVAPLVLSQKGSLYLTRPTLMTHTAHRPTMLSMAHELFEVVTGGAVRIEVNQTWPLAEAAEAHRALEARQTTGSTILIP